MTLEGYRYITPQVTSDDPRMQRAIDGWLGLYEACYVIGNELREGRRKLIEEGLVAAEDGEPYGMDSREHRPTPEQLFKAVVHGAKGLNEAGARYVLAGGLALNYHGHERATRDVDFFVCHDPEKLDELRGPLARQDVRPHREEGPSFLPPDAMFWFEPLQFGLPDAPPVNVDLLVSQHEFMAFLHATGIESSFGGVRLRVVGLEGFLVLKLRAFRKRDQGDLITVWLQNGKRADLDVLGAWVKRFGLEPNFEQMLNWTAEESGRRLG